MVDKEEVFEYLDELREYGVTNMSDGAEHIYYGFSETGITMKESKELLIEWMKTFGERHADE